MGFADITSVGVSLVVVITFIILILIDFVNALIKRAHWVPGSIKIDLWMIHTSRVMLCVVVAYLLPGMARRGSDNSWLKVWALIIAILINMTSELYRVRTTCAALSFSKYHKIWLEERCASTGMFVLSATINFMSFTCLILLLGSAYLASKGIEVIIAQKRPLLLSSSKPPSSSPPSEPKWQWESVEEQVLKCFVFSRAYSLDFIIARSALNSGAATVIALQILATFVAWLHLDHMVKCSRPVDKLKLVVAVLQCFFILMGSITVGLRWATTIVYYKRWQKDTWRGVFRREDFWTRSIRDLLEQKQQLEAEKTLNKRIRRLSYKDPLDISLPRFLLYLVLGLQWLTVLVSKTCWAVSLMIFNNRFMGNLLRSIFSSHDRNVFREYPKYKKYLKGLEMLQETAESLWIPNRNSIKQASALVSEGKEDASINCNRLIGFLQGRTDGGSGVRCLEPDSKEHNQLKYLCKPSDFRPLEVEKHFQETTKCSWKMTVVSLIRIMFHLSPLYVQFEQSCSTSHDVPPEAVKLSLDAYSQAWEIIDLVEKMNEDDDSHGILSQAADKLFSVLKDHADKGTPIGIEIRHANAECLKAAIEDLAKQSQKQTELPKGHIGWEIFGELGEAVNKAKSAGESEKDEKSTGNESATGRAKGAANKEISAEESTNDGKSTGNETKKDEKSSGNESEHSMTAQGNDSMDWKAAASGAAVYKLCKSIDLASVTTADDIKELLKEIKSSVADIIYACVGEVHNKAAWWSAKCARDSDEKHIARALYAVGKAKRVSKMLEQEKKEQEKKEQERVVKEQEETEKGGQQR